MTKQASPKADAPVSRVPGVLQLANETLQVLKRHWKVFLGIIVIYAVCSLFMQRGLGVINTFLQLRESYEFYYGSLTTIADGISVFFYMMGAGVTSPAGAGYQLIIGVVTMLALIWALRQMYAEDAVRIRDGFYRGMQPLIPFMFVLVVVGLGLLPAVLGLASYNAVISSGIAATPVEHLVWGGMAFGTVVLSLFLFGSLVFSLFVVSLPNMAPVKAITSGWQLVKGRRWMVFRKLLFLPVALLVIGAVVMVPFIMWAPVVVGILSLFTGAVALTLSTSYLYAFYRSLL